VLLHPNESVVERTVSLDQKSPRLGSEVGHYPLRRKMLACKMAIPGLWRYDGKALRIYQLQVGEYQST